VYRSLFLALLLIGCGRQCQSETLVLHHAENLVLDIESIDHWIDELERGTGRRWKVKQHIEPVEISDIYEAQKFFGFLPGYHLVLHSPAYHDGYFWLTGLGYALGCTPPPYRVAVCSFTVRGALLGSRTACLHELGHLLGAGHSLRGTMQSANHASQFYSPESVSEIRACKTREGIC
jgi:hypothetical protein